MSAKWTRAAPLVLHDCFVHAVVKEQHGGRTTLQFSCVHASYIWKQGTVTCFIWNRLHLASKQRNKRAGKLWVSLATVWIAPTSTYWYCSWHAHTCTAHFHIDRKWLTRWTSCARLQLMSGTMYKSGQCFPRTLYENNRCRFSCIIFWHADIRCVSCLLVSRHEPRGCNVCRSTWHWNILGWSNWNSGNGKGFARTWCTQWSAAGKSAT